jgi:hypothetical protein
MDMVEAGRLLREIQDFERKLAAVQEIAKVHAFKHEQDEADKRAAASELERIQATARVTRERDAAHWCMTHLSDTGCKGCLAEYNDELCHTVPAIAFPEDNEVECDLAEAESDLAETESALAAEVDKVNELTVKLGEEEKHRAEIVGALQVCINGLEKELQNARCDHLADHNCVAEVTRIEHSRRDDDKLMHVELDKLGAPRKGEDGVVYSPLGRLRAGFDTSAFDELRSRAAKVEGRLANLKYVLETERKLARADLDVAGNRILQLTGDDYWKSRAANAFKRGACPVCFVPASHDHVNGCQWRDRVIPRVGPSESSPNDASEARDILDSLGKALQEVIVMATRAPCKCGQRSDELIGGAGSASSPSESGAPSKS